MQKRYNTARDVVASSVRTVSDACDRMPAEFSSAAARVAGTTPCDPRPGETMLLHGTRPQFLHDILFRGLMKEVANVGLFGRGIYFAESAGKIDQYATVDGRWNKPHTDVDNTPSPLGLLHE